MDKVMIKSAEYLSYLIVATKNGDLRWQAQNLVGKSSDDYVAKLDVENDTDIWLTWDGEDTTIKIRGSSEGERRTIEVVGDEKLTHELYCVVRAQRLSRDHDFATRLVNIAVEYLDKYIDRDETKWMTSAYLKAQDIEMPLMP